MRGAKGEGTGEIVDSDWMFIKGGGCGRKLSGAGGWLGGDGGGVGEEKSVALAANFDGAGELESFAVFGVCGEVEKGFEMLGGELGMAGVLGVEFWGLVLHVFDKTAEEALGQGGMRRSGKRQA
jgi:hypothetical protein